MHSEQLRKNSFIDFQSKYPEEYSTVDKEGREKLLARKSCFV